MIKKLLHIKTKEPELSVDEKIEYLFNMLDEYVIQLNVGEDLAEHAELFCHIMQELREEIKSECGFIIPEVRVRDYSALQENEYNIWIKGELSGQGYLIPNKEGIREEFYYSLKTVLYNNIDKIFTNDIAERYIDAAQKRNGWLIWNVTRVLSVPEIKIILFDIINSGKSINNIGNIFERIGNEILLNGGYQDCYKVHDPHEIAKRVASELRT